MTTAVFCIFAYVWLYITLAVWSPDEIELAEAILTLVFFLLLVILAFSADKYNAYKKKKMDAEKLGEALKRKTFSQDDFYRIIGMQLKNIKKDPRIKNDNEYTSLKGGEKDLENQGNQQIKENGEEKTQKDQYLSNKKKNNDFTEMMKEVKKDKDGYIDVYDLANRLKPQPVQERVLYNRGIGASLSGRKPLYNNIQKQKLKKQPTMKPNEEFGFNTLKYSVKEDKGPLMVKILNKKNQFKKIGVRTIDGSATAGLDLSLIHI